MNRFPPFDEPDYEQPDSNKRDDELQRILNEKKRKELAERYGANFDETQSSLPVDVEAEWLHYIDEFERQFEHAARISVYEYLGSPSVLSPTAVPLDNLQEELDDLLEFMYLNGIAVHFLCEIDVFEAYRFIVDELFHEEVDDIRIPGMTSNFIYEEFYPNDEYDAKIWAQDFLYSLFDHHREGVEVALCQDELYTIAGAPTSVRGMMARVDAFFARHPTIIDTTIKPLTCTVEENYATVEIATTWTSVRTNPDEQWTYTGRSTFLLKRSKYDGWDIAQAKVAGWDSPVTY